MPLFLNQGKNKKLLKILRHTLTKNIKNLRNLNTKEEKYRQIFNLFDKRKPVLSMHKYHGQKAFKINQRPKKKFSLFKKKKN